MALIKPTELQYGVLPEYWKISSVTLYNKETFFDIILDLYISKEARDSNSHPIHREQRRLDIKIEHEVIEEDENGETTSVRMEIEELTIPECENEFERAYEILKQYPNFKESSDI